MESINKGQFVYLTGNWKKFKQLRESTVQPYTEELPTNSGELGNFVLGIYESIVTGRYMPSPPRTYNVIQKADGTARIVPVLEMKDVLVYRFCTMSLEEIIARSRVPNTFGGWSMGGVIRSAENTELETLGIEIEREFEIWQEQMANEIEYAGFATIEPENWFQNWQAFQSVAYSVQRNNPDSRIMNLDLSNFYDSIRLDLLERKIRAHSHTVHLPIIELLFVFLRSWNRYQEGYSAKTVGIPQDESSDSSRLLANFFLQEYDLFMAAEVNHLNGHYTRFADDQIVTGPDEQSLRKLLFKSSVFLRTMGLALNGSKTLLETSAEFGDRWAFEHHKNFDLDPAGVAVSIIDTCIRSNQRDWKWQALVKRLIKNDLRSLSPVLSMPLLELITEDSFIPHLSVYNIRRLKSTLSEAEWSKVDKALLSFLERTPSNQVHFIYIKALDDELDPQLKEKLKNEALTRSYTRYLRPSEGHTRVKA